MIGRNRVKDGWRQEMARFSGDALRQWRRERHLTQDAMAALLGLSSRNAVRTIQDWERGRTKMPGWVPRIIWLMDKVERLARKLEALRRRGHVESMYQEGETEWASPPAMEPQSNVSMPTVRKYIKRKTDYWAGRAASAGGPRATPTEALTDDASRGHRPAAAAAEMDHGPADRSALDA